MTGKNTGRVSNSVEERPVREREATVTKENVSRSVAHALNGLEQSPRRETDRSSSCVRFSGDLDFFVHEFPSRIRILNLLNRKPAILTSCQTLALFNCSVNEGVVRER